MIVLLHLNPFKFGILRWFFFSFRFSFFLLSLFVVSTMSSKERRATTSGVALRFQNSEEKMGKEDQEIVELNIGGVHYVTTVSTLTKVRRPQEENYFSCLFSGRFRPTLYNGAYFIDRDGEPFAPILRYLRTGKFFVQPPNDPIVVQEEADFYCIPLPCRSRSLVPCRFPRVDGVYMDESFSILIQFLPSHHQVVIASKLGENQWLDFCRTNSSYFRYAVKEHYFVITPIGIQDEYSMLSGSMYESHLQPDLFSRLSRLGKLTFISSKSRSKSHSADNVPEKGVDYVLHKDYAFIGSNDLRIRISMLRFNENQTVTMLIKIGSQPQRVKVYRYKVREEMSSLGGSGGGFQRPSNRSTISPIRRTNSPPSSQFSPPLPSSNSMLNASPPSIPQDGEHPFYSPTSKTITSPTLPGSKIPGSKIVSPTMSPILTTRLDRSGSAAEISFQRELSERLAETEPSMTLPPRPLHLDTSMSSPPPSSSSSSLPVSPSTVSLSHFPPPPPPLPPPGQKTEEDENDYDFHELPISSAKTLLRTVAIGCWEDTKTDVHLICLSNNLLVEIDYFLPNKGLPRYHPRITRIFTLQSENGM